MNDVDIETSMEMVLKQARTIIYMLIYFLIAFFAVCKATQPISVVYAEGEETGDSSGSSSSGYSAEQIAAAKAWLSAHGYAPTRAGAAQAYQDYLDGKLDNDPDVRRYKGLDNNEGAGYENDPEKASDDSSDDYADRGNSDDDEYDNAEIDGGPDGSETVAILIEGGDVGLDDEQSEESLFEDKLAESQNELLLPQNNENVYLVFIEDTEAHHDNNVIFHVIIIISAVMVLLSVILLIRARISDTGKQEKHYWQR